METTNRQESDRVIGKLKVAIRLLGHTNREIERRLGYTPSYLTRLFSGQIELRFEHVVDIARAMGLTADEFFAFAYPPRREQPSEAFQQLNALLDELRPAPPPARTLSRTRLGIPRSPLKVGRSVGLQGNKSADRQGDPGDLPEAGGGEGDQRGNRQDERRALEKTEALTHHRASGSEGAEVSSLGPPSP
jgi:transcriptional regulator with XRE-family HTH domain